MVVPLGTPKQPEDLAGLLLDCHARIRHFLRVAVEVGARQDLSDPAVVDACQRVERYFTQALPLHVADEEESLLPRLNGLDPELDRRLEAMRAEHETHDPLVAGLLAASGATREAPADPAARQALREAAERLTAALEPHLQAEEAVVLPAVRARLSPAAQAEVISELRARRRPAG